MVLVLTCTHQFNHGYDFGYDFKVRMDGLRDSCTLTVGLVFQLRATDL